MLYTGILWAAEWGSIGYVQGIITASNLRNLSVSQNDGIPIFSDHVKGKIRETR